MDTGTKYLVELANQECITGSLNGPALLETLRAITASEAAATDTYEGYSAWSIALHTLYFKHQVGLELGATIPKYEHEETDFPPTPSHATDEEWAKVADEIEACHKGFVEALEKATPETLDRRYEAWKMPLGRAITWIISHDIAHNAQIRNMGLPSLREEKHG